MVFSTQSRADQAAERVAPAGKLVADSSHVSASRTASVTASACSGPPSPLGVSCWIAI